MLNNVFFTFQEQRSDEYFEAKFDKFDKRNKFVIYHEVNDGRKRITGRLVLSRKLKNGPFYSKPRSVVYGFQDISHVQTYFIFRK